MFTIGSNVYTVIADAIVEAAEQGTLPTGVHADIDQLADAAHALLGLELAIYPTTIMLKMYDDSEPRVRRPEGIIIPGNDALLQRALNLMADFQANEGLVLFARVYLVYYGVPLDRTLFDDITAPFVITEVG